MKLTKEKLKQIIKEEVEDLDVHGKPMRSYTDRWYQDWIEVFYEVHDRPKPVAYIQITKDMVEAGPPYKKAGRPDLTPKGFDYVKSFVPEYDGWYWSFAFISKRTIDSRMKEIPKIIPLQEEL